MNGVDHDQIFEPSIGEEIKQDHIDPIKDISSSGSDSSDQSDEITLESKTTQKRGKIKLWVFKEIF